MARPRSRIPESSSSIRDNQNQSEDDECRLDIMRKGRSTWWPPHPIRAWLKLINLPDLGSSIKDPMVDQAKSPKPCSRIAKVVGLFCFALIVLVTSLGSWPQRPSHRGGVGGVGPNVYSGYRRLREQVIADFSDIGGLLNRGKELGLCGRDREDFIPCYNVTRENNNDRHCGYSSRIGNKCLVRPPKDYKIPLRWPTGRDVIWSNNVKITKDQLLSSGSLTKRLMLLEDNQISFRSEDALVIDGVEDYSHQIAEMIGLRNESEFIEAGVRIVLDIDCGFGSFGAHLLSKNLLTMCIAPYEMSGSQVQLALERGLPAMLGSFNSKQLPYPALSFDMVHCAKCSIDWEKKDGSYLIEVDRVLKPGGYFVWTSPLMDFHGAMLKKENQNKWNFVQEFAQKLCWVLMSQQEETVLWQKTANKECYTSRKLRREPPLCQKGQDSESPYYQPLLPCISGIQNRRWIPIQNQTKWPARMFPNSDSLAIHGIHAEELSEDNKAWSSMIKDYWSLLTPLLFSDHPKRPGEEDPLPPFNMLRNVMDMNAQYGGLNAALLEAGKTVWVMNVVPTSGSNTLPLILDRGFVGVLHDWCEAFPTYPRTYDMLHAAGLLSQEMNHQYKCGLLDLFLEMDRILRPEGWVVLRDEVQKIEEARSITTQLRWDARIVEIEDDNEQRLLVCQKPFVRK